MHAAHQSGMARMLQRLVSAVAAMGFLVWGCSEPPQSRGPIIEDRVGAAVAYVFEPDAEHYLAAPRPFALDPQMTVAEGVNQLAEHLSRSYFHRDPGSDPPIRFEIVNLHRLELPHRTYRLAVVDMVDPRLEALQVFFQGSSGGQTTFFMLTATLLQPQMTPPLVDGLILLYNGDAFPEIDHVNFRGIVTPGAARAVVTKALSRHGAAGPDAAG